MKLDDCNITISTTLDNTRSTTIIPILRSQLKTQTLKSLLSNYMDISSKYTEILDHIYDNFKNNDVSLATLTIDLNSNISNKPTTSTSSLTSRQSQLTISKSTKKHNITKAKSLKAKSLTLKNMKSSIHQLFLVLVDNTNFQKNDDSELREALRVTGSMIYSLIKNNYLDDINILYIINNTLQDVLLEGLLLSSYKFDKYKTSKALNKKTQKYHLHHINLVIPQNSKNPLRKNNNTKNTKKNNNKQLLEKLTHQTNIIKSVFLARDLINEPANNARSTRFISQIKNYISSNKLPITLEILDKQQLEKLGMGLLLAVGKGSNSENSPKLVIMKYNPKKDSLPEYILLGKGITFDTGGIDLKRSGSMIEMKSDLSGAASVMAFLLGYAKSNGSKCIYTICPFAENSIGPNAIKPSDVVTAYDKRTVEITDTDAEGRLVLADCLAYAVEKYPKAKLIDFATLTGQQEKISGKMFSCILGNNDKEIDKLIITGKKINEPLVKLPILDKQVKKLESYVADIKNVNFTSQADIIMSSLFMKQFIKKNTQWIHIDIAGPSYKLNEIVKYASPEASGIGVRLLFEYFC